MNELIDRLERQGGLSEQEYVALIHGRNEESARILRQRAAAVRQMHYGNDVYLRGLIEFTNYCKNDCYYCGIRCSNRKVERYRLTEEQILDCCQVGYGLGYRTFVLQGGEDSQYTPERIENLVRQIKTRWSDCAVTLSVGEQPEEVYRCWFEAGANRYLLRHETADSEHYRQLHPERQSLENRMECLRNLKKIGYQTGCGFMVGAPGQGAAQLAKDLMLIHELQPEMVGIGPFIPQKDTPLGQEPAGTLELTLYLLSIIRLMLPQVLLPATTALGTIHPQGRELGLLAGANVCMPNLSPVEVRQKYALYDNKICTGEEAAECVQCLRRRIESVGFQVAATRGDHVNKRKEEGKLYV
ncbi:MAG: [FeFe] hydrogenase H-cluster radical SAM maturase HydE [Ruminococcaceae bacterium]|nr:[FeFe] hydrogenase H-cluster radical SAM maturase HydE [Oscillospiraceae bacterium]